MRCILIVCNSVFSLFMLSGIVMFVNGVSLCIYVRRPPPCLCGLSVLIGV